MVCFMLLYSKRHISNVQQCLQNKVFRVKNQFTYQKHVVNKDKKVKRNQ